MAIKSCRKTVENLMTDGVHICHDEREVNRLKKGDANLVSVQGNKISAEDRFVLVDENMSELFLLPRGIHFHIEDEEAMKTLEYQLAYYLTGRVIVGSVPLPLPRFDP